MAPGAEEIQIFAHEIHPSGCRTFITATPTSFFEKYSCMPNYNRSFYEVLNSRKPCNLFMDIDFYPALNQRLNEEMILKTPSTYQMLLSYPYLPVSHISLYTR